MPFPVVIAVAKEWEFDVDFFPECILEAFTKLLPETFTLDKLMVIIVESNENIRDIAAELIKLRFGNRATSTIFKVAVFPGVRLICVIQIMRLGCWNVFAIELTSFPILDGEFVPVVFQL